MEAGSAGFYARAWEDLAMNTHLEVEVEDRLEELARRGRQIELGPDNGMWISVGASPIEV